MLHARSAALNRRHNLVREAFARQATGNLGGLDALVVASRPNIFYLTNFTGSSALAVLTRDRLHFVTDFRYVTAVEDLQKSDDACPDLELTVVDGTYDATLARLLASLNFKRVGFEAAHITVSRYNWLIEALRRAESPPELVPTEQIVERVRVRKDEHEIALFREAARRLSTVASGVFHEIRAGRTEQDIARAIDARILGAGFERTAFDTIVASGPQSALPHAHPTERTLGENDLVVLDFGGVYRSYCVDLTRTVMVGRASSKAREVHAAVLEAHDRAIQAVAPGRSRFEIDAAARDSLAARGLGEAFGHGTGHGLGLEIHEDPRITRRTGETAGAPEDERVTAGMVFTIEPGAYLPGWGGVRIEDDVLVTEHGVELLTTVTTDLLEL